MDGRTADVTSFLGISAHDTGGVYPDAELPQPDVPYPIRKSLRSYVAATLNSVPVLLIVMLTTVYLLFANDTRLLAFTVSADFVFEVLSSSCFFFFLVELVLRCWIDTDVNIVEATESVESLSTLGSVIDSLWRCVCCGRRRHLYVRGYAVSFLFFLDIIAVISILPEIPWIWGDLSVTTSSLSATRASRAARVGARLGRIVRVVRIVRIVRLWTAWWPTMQSGKYSPADPEDGQVLRESRMGYHLNTSTTRTVIVLVLLTLLLAPLFDWAPLEYGPLIAASMIHDANIHRFASWEGTVQTVQSHYSLQSSLLGSSAFLQGDADLPFLVQLQLSPATGFDPAILVNRPDVYNNLRRGAWTELSTFYFSDASAADANVTVTTFVSFNTRPLQRLQSLLSIFLTLFIVVLLLFGALQFSANAQLLVLRPIERMLEFVERIAVNPSTETSSSPGESEITYETQLLENVIKKIVGILRIGFGAAGMHMISNHISTRRRQLDASVDLISRPESAGDSRIHLPGAGAVASSNRADFAAPTSPSLLDFSPFPWRSQFYPGRRFLPGDSAVGSGLFDPFRSGRRVRVIIVRIGIPHFSTVCELLGERALTYNNLFAKIIHDTALAWDGAVLANGGGQFTCAWVIDDAWEELLQDRSAHAFIMRGPAGDTPSPSKRSRSLFDVTEDETPSLATPALSPSSPTSPPLRYLKRQASLGAAIIGDHAPEVDSNSGPGVGDGLNPVQTLIRHISQADILAVTERSAPPSPRKRLEVISAPQLHRRSSAAQSRAGIRLPVSRPSPPSEDCDASSSVIILPFREHKPQELALGAPSESGAGSTGIDVDGDGPAARARAVEVLAEKAREVTDKALAAVLKMIAAVRRSHDIARSPELASLRCSQKLRGLRPDLWVGIHAVSAVECAIGTGRKVNPALLSPYAETARLLQRLAPFYGAGVLLSGTTHALLSAAVQPLCRLVDELSGPHSARIYAYDTWDWRAAPSLQSWSSRASNSSVPRQHLLPFSSFGNAMITNADIFNMARTGLRERERCISLLGEADIIEHPVEKTVFSAMLFQTDSELCALHGLLPPDYYRCTELGVRAYLRGDWAAARASFGAAVQASKGLYEASAAPGDGGAQVELARPALPASDEWRHWLDAASLRVVDAMARHHAGRDPLS